jgi:hypothetical protein
VGGKKDKIENLEELDKFIEILKIGGKIHARIYIENMRQKVLDEINFEE